MSTTQLHRDKDVAKYTRHLGKGTEFVAPGVVWLRCGMVNVYFLRASEGSNDWVLVDAGLSGYLPQIRQAARRLCGVNYPPRAILLTHGHFDHVGCAQRLADEWDAKVYAHRLELPYLTGVASYAPPDPWVGGAMSLTSPIYPRGPIDLRWRVEALPDDGSVPGVVGWRWLPTPGHSPGHVSFWRETDRTLIAGDAFVTTRQESLLSVLTQRQAVFGPPPYFTHDWQSAERSVKQLAMLNPQVAATGHGTPMHGQWLREQLSRLATNFHQTIPSQGRYAHDPVIASERGPVVVPGRRAWTIGMYVALGALATTGLLAVGAIKYEQHRGETLATTWRRYRAGRCEY